MAKKKKTKKHDGSTRLPILVFELSRLGDIIEECNRKKEVIMALALDKIRDEIMERRTHLKYKDE